MSVRPALFFFVLAITVCIAQMIDLNAPPDENENVHNFQPKKHSFDLNVPDPSPVQEVEAVTSPKKATLHSNNNDAETFYEIPHRTPAFHRSNRGRRDEAWNNKIRESFLKRKIQKEQGILLPKDHRMKPVRGSEEWKMNISKGMQKYLKSLGPEGHAERQRVRTEKKKQKLSASIRYIRGGHN
ncbi:uncharacterized protein FA14DRAFT_185041 [Meira miltonrushii]|uniref:Uncharacterized protein n=1 Tax=Meira miltonrushii TaxID=1280837 RepID=A0A316VAI0_9BASI|nr:uncharacterized protein FA14DRAFT_185041 [Meira miltonrushii]PWN33203.1 hypothetical protein FA14DRAFT_185041 [Meira miltonrushii]